MAETIVHTGEQVVDGAVTGLAGAVGAVTNEAAHHAQQLVAHAEKLTNLEGDIAWIKTRLDETARAVTEAPSSAISELRSALADLRSEFTMQTAALSEAIASGTTEEPQTDPPPPAPNEADPPEKVGPLGGLRKALHRLL